MLLHLSSARLLELGDHLDPLWNSETRHFTSAERLDLGFKVGMPPVPSLAVFEYNIRMRTFTIFLVGARNARHFMHIRMCCQSRLY